MARKIPKSMLTLARKMRTTFPAAEKPTVLSGTSCIFNRYQCSAAGRLVGQVTTNGRIVTPPLQPSAVLVQAVRHLPASLRIILLRWAAPDSSGIAGTAVPPRPMTLRLI